MTTHKIRQMIIGNPSSGFVIFDPDPWYVCVMKRFVSLFIVLVSLLASPAYAQDVRAGIQAYERGDYAAALREWRPLAERGDGDAQGSLGLLYALGQGVPRDFDQAIRWFRLSAGQGYAIGQNNLAVMYQNGHGVPKDHAEALKLYRMSAAQGYTVAQYSLGTMYENGFGVKPDVEEAYLWYTLAAEKGHNRANQARLSLGPQLTAEQKNSVLARFVEHQRRSADASEPTPADPASPPEAATSKPQETAPPPPVSVSPPADDAAKPPAPQPAPAVPKTPPLPAPLDPPADVAAKPPPQATFSPLTESAAKPPPAPPPAPLDPPAEVAAKPAPQAPPAPPAEVAAKPPPQATVSPPAESTANPPPTPNTVKNPPASGGGAFWRIQLASLNASTDAEAEWKRVQQINQDLLDGLTLHIQQVTLAKGTFFRLQVGPLADRATAVSLCRSLISREQDCLVVAP